MNDIDINILKILQDNARVTTSEISSKVNLSIPAVSERIRKLESAEIIQQYTTIINPQKLNKNLTAIMFVNLGNPQFNEKFIEFIGKENEVTQGYYLAGDFDYALKIITEDTFTLEKVLNRIKSVRGVQKTRTFVVLSTIKNKHSVTPEDCQT